MADINRFATTTVGYEDPNYKPKPSKRKRKSKARRVIITILIALFILFVLIAMFILLTISTINNVPSNPEPYPAYVPSGVPDTPIYNEVGVTNILILGSDSRGTDSGRSDVIMLVSINNRKGTIGLMSILRDTYVDVPQHDMKKINAAYQFGGGDLTAQTIENNFRIKIDGWFSTDFVNFPQIIDKMNGIDIYITSKEAAVINKNSGSSNTVYGDQIAHLDGAQALTYSRDRSDIESDWGRTTRQRKVINEIISKFRTLDPLTMYDIITTYLPNVSTNMNDFQLTGMTMGGLLAAGYEVKESMLPLSGEYSEKNFNLYPKYEKVIPRLHDFLSDPRNVD